MASTDDLEQLERDGWDALSAGPEAAAGYYAHVLDDHPIMLLPGDLVITDRAAMIQAMGGQPWASYRLQDVRVLDLGEGAGAVTYAVVAQREGSPEYSALVSSVYARRDGRWRLALHQQTPR
jgi:hypothetical protein